MEFAQILTVPLYVDVIKVFLLGLFAFVLAILLAPVLTAFLYNKRFRTRVKRKTISGERAPVTKAATKGKEGTPLMGGLLVWGTVLILGGLFLLVSFLSGDDFWINFNFVSRSQTWLPMFALATTGFIGLVDDYFSCRGKGQGVKFLYRFLWLIAVALLGAWWFYFKLEYSSIHLPGLGDWEIGWWYMLYFVLVIVATAVSSNETDGLDGLNGGILLIAYGAFTFIAFFQERIDLAAFCAVICGGLLAFLWFNIYPARFFM
ncbi:hypothetical protein KJ912_03860, partial [Patescibacteria group bacterium]|nr:hypothetical protein [Patescibacteria group bacterium]